MVEIRSALRMSAIREPTAFRIGKYPFLVRRAKHFQEIAFSAGLNNKKCPIRGKNLHPKQI
jgi:hypothetical protein